LLGVDVGLQEAVLDIANEPGLPVVFVVSFADSPAMAEEFGLYLYLDLDQNPATGLDMSSGPVALPGIDRLIGATLPDGDTWTQLVAKGGYDAEILRDATKVSARVEVDQVIVVVGRALLDEHASLTAEPSAPTDGVAAIGRALAGDSGGGTPDAFTLYIGTARSIDALDYFNGDQGIQVPLAMTVPQDIAYPPGPAGGS
jgi:hypothetical protein